MWEFNVQNSYSLGFWGFLAVGMLVGLVIWAFKRGGAQQPPAAPPTPPAPLAPAPPTVGQQNAFQSLAQAQARILQNSTYLLESAELSVQTALTNKRADERQKYADDIEQGRSGTNGGAQTGGGGTQRGTSYTLTVNGAPVGQGQTRVDIAGGYVNLTPAPGTQGYAPNTRVTLTVVPDALGATASFHGAGQRGPLEGVVTLRNNRNVTVTIVPPTNPSP
ncbi:MAG TPA: hypothetical protein VFE94_00450 [Candidatus Paceibacterota bacterium]|nr:hypothetical protein [Candidatus Paceibacterota bacterium]